MPRRTGYIDDVNQVADAQNGLITAEQLREIGMPPASVSYRLGSVWTRVLPGVHSVTRAELNDDQRLRAALLYAGAGAVVTGASALQLHGLDVVRHPLRAHIHLLIPERRQRQSAGFVVVERTRRPVQCDELSTYPVAPAARAAIDASRRMKAYDDVRAMLLAAVQRRLCQLDDLANEVDTAPRQGSAHARAAMDDLRAGVLSVPEARVRERILARGMDLPQFNVTLCTREGQWICEADAYWDEGVILETDSREHHFLQEQWEATMARHARMTSFGLLVIHASPQQMATAGDRILELVEQARAQARRGPRPNVVARPRIAQ
jgi:hypothetical protein